MKTMTVSEVSRKFDVSTRMLRYYEQEGLICSLRKEGYAYRVYDEEAGAVMDSFIRESKLFEAKPDARLFGFETVRDMALDGEHGYENWVTIPEAFEVTAPLIKKQFLGGLYAVHTIDFPNFNEWERLKQWVEKHEIYAPNYCEEGNLEMKGCLEEYLNWVYSCHMGWPKNGIDGKVDLYLPIKER